jgi:hypothetical protein
VTRELINEILESIGLERIEHDDGPEEDPLHSTSDTESKEKTGVN